MSNSTSCGVKIDFMLAREFFNLSVFLEVCLAFVLHVVVQRKNDLLGLVNLRGTNS
jgi:hypothetical protein